MATHDYNLANQDGASFRSDLNNALAAIVSNNSSSTAPATTFAHQIWVDTTANVIKQRNAANDAWVELWRIDGGFNAKTFSSNVTLNAQSDLRFADSDSSNWVAFQAPATVSSNVTWTLPDSDGTSGQVIETNGSGVLSWADAGGVQDNITEGNTSAEVVDTGSNGHFKVVTEGTEALRVDSSQRLLAGTSSSIGVNSKFQAININNSQLATFHLAYNGSAGAEVILSHSRNATPGSFTIVNNNDPLGQLHFCGDDGTDYLTKAASIEAYVDGTPGVNDMPGRLVFSTTADGGSSPTERFRIASNGAWGLGGATYGTSGQVLTSQGSGSAPQWATPAGGKILQVVQTLKTDTFSSSSTSFADVSGLSLSITPSSSSSKILISGYLLLSTQNASVNYVSKARITRNGSAIFIGDASGTRDRSLAGSCLPQNGNTESIGFTYLDSPATTSAVTYKWQISAESSSYPALVGRTNDNGPQFWSAPSNLVAMEVAA